MKAGNEKWVVDASVGIKLFLPEPHSPQARDLFHPKAKGPLPKLYVPDLFYAECANTLWKYVRRFGYPALEARRDISDLRALGLYSVSTADLLPKALDLALEWGISAYDACYLSLAEEMEVSLVTADRKLFDRLHDGSPRLTWIGDLGNG